MALAGISAVGEFHYLHHGPGGVPYADPNAMGDALVAAARRGRHPASRCSTPATSAAASASSSTPIQRRFSDGDARAWADARRGAAPTVPASRIGAAVHSVRAVDPAAIAVVAAWAAGRGAPLHAHVSEQPAENEQVLAAHGAHPGRAARRGRRARRAVHRRPRHPPHDRRHRAARRGRAARAASARRPSATSPTASARRSPCATPAPA